MSLVKSLANKWGNSSERESTGKSDLLLRFFESQFFDVWIALSYLHTHAQGGVQDYLCNRLHELGEEAIEKYLLQFVYLAVSRPGQALERTIVDLCSKSFRVAIKTQWLLVALCQDHPKNKAVEDFRERAYRAALEGKWEVPIRNPKLDPLSPYHSQVMSPVLSPAFSPGTLAMLAQHEQQAAAARLASGRDPPVATQPPRHVVMSPPNHGAVSALTAAPPAVTAPHHPGIGSDASAGDGGAGASGGSGSLTTRKSSGLAIDLGCLLLQDQRGLGLGAGAGSTAAPSLGQLAPVAAPGPHVAGVANGHAAGVLANGFGLGTSGGGSGAQPRAGMRAGGVAAAIEAAGADASATVSSLATASAAPPLERRSATAPGVLASVSAPAPAPTQPSRASAFTTAAANAMSAVASSLADRIQSLKRELGEGEGVSALLERSRAQGAATLVDDDALLSDDEFGGRPMSPLTRLRHDTFGATLDFIDALCDASSALTSYSQEERYRALRHGLDHINREIEAANRRDVAIWFPMGRGGDRVLRLASKEAVLLNSREKAPFMLFVEVLEGQQECGDSLANGDASCVCGVASTAGPIAASDSCVGGGGAAAAGTAPGGGGAGGGGGGGGGTPLVEFGRRETYGIALTGIGAQHQQQYMHASPGHPGPGGGGVSGAGAHHFSSDGYHQGGSTTSGRASLPSHGPGTTDTASTWDTPGGLSPSMSLSSQLRSMAGSPAAGGHPAQPAAAAAAGPGAAAAAQQPAAAAAAASPLPPPPQLPLPLLPPLLPPPQVQTPQGGQGGPPPLLAPSPTRACSGAYAGILEERAAAALAASSPRPFAAAQVQQQPGPCSGSGASLLTPQGSGPAPPGPALPAPLSSSSMPQPMGAVIIPTRSASSTNIAAAALAAAAMAAATGNGNGGGVGGSISGAADPSALLLLSRASNGGGAVGPASTSASTSASAGQVAAVATVVAAASAAPPASNASSSSSPASTAAGAAPPAGTLPPRPPPLPVGSISPISAAREVSPQNAAAHASGAAVSASSLLRRVRGDRADEPQPQPQLQPQGQQQVQAQPAAATAAVATRSTKEGKEGSSLSAFGVVRSLCFSSAEPGAEEARLDAIASAAVAAAASASAGRPHGSLAQPQPAVQAGQPGAAPASHRTHLSGARPRPPTGELSEEDVHELQALGCLSPPTVAGRESSMTSRLAALLASLRGEAPLVRVRIRALPEGLHAPHALPHSVHAHAPPAAVASFAGGGSTTSAATGTASVLPNGGPAAGSAPCDASSSSGGAASGPSHSSSSAPPAEPSGALGPFTLAPSSRAKAAAPPAAPPPPPVPEDGGAGAASTSGADGSGERSKAMALLSRLGLRRKPATATADDDADAPAASASALAPAAAAAEGGGAGSGAYRGGGAVAWGSRRPGREPRLVVVTFEVAQGVNLAIPSPHRKSRRTPSHEAIEMLADKYKVHQMPPPYECGPPLFPPPYSLTTYSVAERASEEGEGSDRPELGPAGDSQPMAAAPAGPDAAIAVLSSGGGAPATADAAAPAAAPASLPQPQPPASVGAASQFLQRISASLAPSTASAAGAPLDAPAPAPAAAAVQPPASSSSAGASSSGLAASLQSSLTRMLGRSQQHSSDGTGGTPPSGPSPRGGSPVRGAGGPAPVAAAGGGFGGGGGAASRLARFIGGSASGSTAASAPGHEALPAGALPAVQQPHPTLPVQQQPPPPQLHGTSRSAGGSGAASGGAATAAPSAAAPKFTDGRTERESAEERRHREAVAVYGERWAAKVKRIQAQSPHGRRAGWALRCVIVKSGDDCRQELLALQVVRTFGDIFRDAGLPLWVRHYEVLVTSNRTALIEMVPNTLSIHTIKSRSAPGASLSDHFFAKFGRSGTPGCTAAQRRFTESLAAYSLICYLLQIKDRHNGNILLDDDGRIVHIDFGFLLSNSPGGVNFESAPFKLTRELLEVMDSNSDGRPSEMFDYFKVLMIQGFLSVRKHGERIVLLVKMMSKSGFPCFKGGDRAVKALEKRMQLSLTEVQCVAHVLQLIAESLDAWRTRQYDYYQRVLNGIL